LTPPATSSGAPGIKLRSQPTTPAIQRHHAQLHMASATSATSTNLKLKLVVMGEDEDEGGKTSLVQRLTELEPLVWRTLGK